MMREVFIQIFGTYQPIDGCADWSYIGGVAIFAICLWAVLYGLLGVLKR